MVDLIMDFGQAVDIYFDSLEPSFIFSRRKDGRRIRFKYELNPKVIGQIALEGLAPQVSNKIDWENNDNHIVCDGACSIFVVKHDHKIVVGTPICNWGKAPDIIVRKEASHLELGEAILKQIDYSIKKKRDEVDPQG